MRTYVKNRRHTLFEVESLEGKIVLSAASAMPSIAPPAETAPLVAEAASFSGTVAGSYNVSNVPILSHIMSLSASGMLGGAGQSHVSGKLYEHKSGEGRLVGQLSVTNSGGSMTLNVYQTGTAGTYLYRVANARGNDAAFRGQKGHLTIAHVQTLSVPFYTSGRAILTFTAG